MTRALVDIGNYMDIDKKIEIIESCFLFYLYRMCSSRDPERKAIVLTTEKIVLSLLEIEKISLQHQYGLALSKEKCGRILTCLDNLKSLQTINKNRYYYPVKSDFNDEISFSEVTYSARISLQTPLKSYSISINIAEQANVNNAAVLAFLKFIFFNEAHPLDSGNGYFLPLLKKLDTYFEQDKSLKAVYVDLNYNFNWISKEFIKNHFRFFLQLLKEHRQYRGDFHKLDYSVTTGFTIFFIGLFENLKSITVNHYYRYIEQIWQKAFEKFKGSSPRFEWSSGLTAVTKFRNVITDSSPLTNNIAIVGKEGRNYQKFIEGPLAYIALIDEFLPIFLNGEKLEGDLCVTAYPSVHDFQDLDTPKKTRKHKPQKIYQVQKESLFKKYFSEIRLLKPLEKDIKDICFCYEYIGQFIAQEEKEIWEKLLQIEVITLLAQHWKQPASEIIDGEIVNHDLGKLLIRVIGNNPTLFRATVIKKSNLFGIRTSIFFKAFKHIENNNSLDKSILNKYLWFWRDLINEIRNTLNLPIQSFLPKLELLLKIKTLPLESARLILEKRPQIQITKEQTVQEWLSIQERSRRQSFRKLDEYCCAMLSYKNVHKVIRIQLGSEATQDIKILPFFDKLIRQSMDPLQRSFSAIQGYLGCWEFDFKNQYYYLELNLFLDAHYVDGNLQPLLESFHKKINEKIKKNNGPTSLLLSNSQLFEINLNDQSNGIIHILEEFMPEKITPKKVNLKKYLRTWCFYLAHRDLYCLTYFLPVSQKSIRGKLSYRDRNSSKRRFSP